MSMIDEMPHSSAAKARDKCELSLIDARAFHFMVDGVPNFSTYIMRVLARRIRGMSRAM
jgi:CRP-like cAMP-binding protein